MTLPPLFEPDDWLYVAQCLWWQANQQEQRGIAGDGARSSRIAYRIVELTHAATVSESLDCTPANPCHHCSECSR